MVSFSLGEFMGEAHEVLAMLMLGVVCIHIMGVIIESYLHRENLVYPMISGYKFGNNNGDPVTRHGTVGMMIFLLALLGGLVFFWGYLMDSEEQPYLIFTGPTLPDNALWRQECGDCHLAFHPTLLPARSWRKLLDTQDQHFDEDLALDEDTMSELETFLINNAAETGLTEAARKINASVPATETPLTITKTDYWKQKHRDIKETYWKHTQVKGKSNCSACHLDAEAGTFEDAAMRLPKLK
jgi:hypothetical protein